MSADRATPTSEESAGYEAVRDSWVDPQPAPTARMHSDPPQLPSSVREQPAARPAELTGFVDRMMDRLAASDYAGALLASEALLRLRPRDADALDCAEMSRTELRKIYESRLGSLDRTPGIAMLPGEIALLPLDAFAGFVLSRVDGTATLQDIAYASGVASDQTLRVLSELYLRGVISLDGPHAPESANEPA
jgi:hypothetical protein